MCTVHSGDCPMRGVTNEEFEAFKWKCSLHKMPAPMIKDMALKLDDEVLANIVNQYNGRRPRSRTHGQSDSFLREIAMWITRRKQ